jgi:hypothetical protein
MLPDTTSFTTENFLHSHGCDLLVVVVNGQIVELLSVGKASRKYLEQSGAPYVKREELPYSMEERILAYWQERLDDAVRKVWPVREFSLVRIH